jgi:YD repeat-containing protein
MNSDKLFAQCPVRNESVVGAQVYSHSGEYSPHAIDFGLPARGVSFQFMRKYRSANRQAVGPMGRGWTFTYAKALEQEGDGILYHDGLGRIHHFKSMPSKDSYLSPDGLYMLLEAAGDTFSLRRRYGGVLTFERPEIGGRLLSIEDRNGNTLGFEYHKNAIQILDSLGRRIDICLDQNRVVSLSYAGRAWQYIYSDDGCLIEAIQPPTKETPDGPRTRYVYDEAFQLVSITDPNNQVYLRNFYDDYGRMSQQKHGNGTFTFAYETIGKTDLGFPIYRTQVQLKNGALLDLKHDAFGHAVERSLLVSAESLSTEDRNGSSGKTVPLITRSIFNRHDEIVRRTGPAGDTIYQTYDEESTDPRNCGNLLEVNRTPAPDVDTDQTALITRYSYEPKYQQVKCITDPRGNTTRFAYDERGNLAKKSYPAVTVPKIGKKANGKRTTRQAESSETLEYNEAGQLIRSTDARGAIVEYFYHPIADPGGARSDANSRSYTQRAGGYLARIVRDTIGTERRLKSKPAHVTTDYDYDAFGNRTTILDGRGNPTRFKYDANNLVIETTSRKPFGYQKHFRYDANGNLREATTSFDHHQYDSVERTIIRKSTTACQYFEYNSLNNLVRRTITGDSREITHTLVRDANENIVRSILPMGNVVEYEYDERRLLIAQRLGVQTRDETETRHTYTRNGRLRSTIDGCGNIVRHDYDGFNRYKGVANATGTVKKQWLDEMGNVTRLQVQGDRVTMNECGEPIANKASVLLEASFQYDELNRRVQMNRAWTDPLTGEPLGKSQWGGEEGVVSTVIEYDDNNLPSKVWRETGNILSLQYDGVNRPVLVNDETGESVSIEYDENSNPVRIERLGPSIKGDKNRFRQISNHEFDELDRLVTRSLNGGPPETVVYNSLGHIIEYKNEAEVSAKYLHDGLGRSSGRATTAIVPRLVNDKQSKQLLVQRVEWDDNNRLIARVNAANHTTKYTYDALNRLSSIIYADGTIRHFERDGNGNIVRLADPNRTIITNRFDAQNRLGERLIERANGGDPQVEKFHYDGLNRLIATVTDSATTVRRYDSLSRLLEESQLGRAIKYEYDSAGNCVRLIYPSGQEVRKSYDSLRRVTEVLDGQSYLIASYSYGSGTQLREQQLGKVLKAAFTYEPGKDWLSSIIYRSIGTGEIIEGNKCRYDAVGNRIQEVQLRRGRDSGERYFYDSANRLVKAQYGVKRLSDSDSPFEEEVFYELSPAGIWQLKTTRDGNGQTLEQAEGRANEREAYLSLGSSRFGYDANGNRILEENGEDKENAKKRYEYDYANRLVRVENLDASEQIVQSIEYVYDTFDRQVVKRITRNGDTKEYLRIWDGSQLIEEWEDGKLAKSFTYGARINEPLKMSLFSECGSEDYFYTLNTRNSVTGLIDPGAKLTEAYHYDIFDKPLRSEFIDSVSQPVLVSQKDNPLLVSGTIWDSHTSLYTLSGNAFDPNIGQIVRGGQLEPGIGQSTEATLEDLLKYHSEEEDKNKKERDRLNDRRQSEIINALTGLAFIVLAPNPYAKVVGVLFVAASVGAYIDDKIYEDKLEHLGVDSHKGPRTGVNPEEGSGGGAGHGGSGGGSGGIGIGGRGSVGGGSGAGGDSSSSGRGEPPQGTGTDITGTSGGAGGGSSAFPAGERFQGDDGNSYEIDQFGNANPVGSGGSGGGFGGGGFGSGGFGGGGFGSGGFGSGGTGCFIAGTPVVFDDGKTKPIETVKVGDYVVSRNETTGNTSAQRVSRTWIHKVQATLLLHLTNGEKVETTKEHRFSVADQGFVGAGQLAPGATLNTQSEQNVQVAGIEPQEQSTTVYNLEVENFHTYFVGKDGVWVHNLKDDEGKGGDDKGGPDGP